MINRMRTTGLVVAAVLLALTVSCATVIPMQLFTLDGDRNQYYIPESRSASGGRELSLSLTFMDDPAIEWPITINYSLISPKKDISVPISETLVSISGASFNLKRVGVFYREIRGDRGTVRVSASMERDAFLKMLTVGADSIIVEYKDGTIIEFALHERFKSDLEMIRLYQISY